MSALWLQADGIRGGQEFDVPPVRPLFYSVRTETGPEAADDRRSACAGDFLIYLWRNSRIFGSGKPVRVVECFECKRKQQVSGAATSTICPSCSAHIDLRDYKITSGFSRSIRTRGNVHLSGKGDLASSSVECQSALIEGRLRGNLHCDTATINYSGKIPGRISARHVVVERKADIHCFRTVRAEHIEIKGRMSGEIIAQSVTVHRKGSLEGDVTARAISVERGGMFSGQLAIGQVGLAQGELLGEQEPTASRPSRVQFSRCRSAAVAGHLATISFMRRLHPRSPYQKLGGYVHLPRLIDKARLHRKGLLDGYNYKTVGFDKHLLAFLKIDGDAFEEIANKLDDDEAILAWVQKNGEQHSPEADRTMERGHDFAPSRYRCEKGAFPAFSQRSRRRRT